jgi:hypothetical protein
MSKKIALIKNKKALIKNKLNIRVKGVSELIASIIVIFALSVFILFFVESITDIYAKIQIDQTVRGYIIRMESAGELSTADKDDLIADLREINAVEAAYEAGGSITVTWNSGQGVKGYGDKITLEVNCPILVSRANMLNGIMEVKKEDSVIYFKCRKQSTAKY